MYMSGACSIYGFLIFLPIILRKGLGYSLVLSFVLTAPPAAFSVVFAIAMSRLSDRYQMRGPFMVGHAALAITGLAMIGFLDHSTPRYIGAFLGEGGTNGVIVTGMAWCQNNMRSDEKRSVGTALQVIVAGIGGVYSALVFRQQVCAFTLTLPSDRLV
jgi:MFS family permease